MSMDDTNSLIEQRKAKLAALRAKGIDPFQNKFTPAETCAAPTGFHCMPTCDGRVNRRTTRRI